MIDREIKRQKLKKTAIKKVKKNIEVKVNLKTGKAEGFLINKPRFVISNSPKTKVGQKINGKISNILFNQFKIKKESSNLIVTRGKKISGKLKKS